LKEEAKFFSLSNITPRDLTRGARLRVSKAKKSGTAVVSQFRKRVTDEKKKKMLSYNNLSFLLLVPFQPKLRVTTPRRVTNVGSKQT
jgi:hypothetical protein